MDEEVLTEGYGDGHIPSHAPQNRGCCSTIVSYCPQLKRTVIRILPQDGETLHVTVVYHGKMRDEHVAAVRGDSMNWMGQTWSNNRSETHQGFAAPMMLTISAYLVQHVPLVRKGFQRSAARPRCQLRRSKLVLDQRILV